MRLVEAVADQDAKAALELVAELAADGVDLRRFVAESVAFSAGHSSPITPNLAEISDEPADVYESWRKAASSSRPPMCCRPISWGMPWSNHVKRREERLMTSWP